MLKLIVSIVSVVDGVSVDKRNGFQVPYLAPQPGEEDVHHNDNNNVNKIGMYSGKEIPIVEDLEIVVPINFV